MTVAKSPSSWPPTARSATWSASARPEAGLEVGAQRVAHEGGVGERGAAMARHVAEDEGCAAAGKRERVVEVATRARAVGGPIGDRGPHGADLLRHRRQQGGLEQAHLLHQLASLAAEAAGAHRREDVAPAEEDGQRGEQRQGRLQLVRHDLHHVAHGARDDRVVALRGSGAAGVLARPRSRCRCRREVSPPGRVAAAGAGGRDRRGRRGSTPVPAPVPFEVRGLRAGWSTASLGCGSRGSGSGGGLGSARRGGRR